MIRGRYVQPGYGEGVSDSIEGKCTTDAAQQTFAVRTGTGSC